MKATYDLIPRYEIVQGCYGYFRINNFIFIYYYVKDLFSLFWSFTCTVPNSIIKPFGTIYKTFTLCRNVDTLVCFRFMPNIFVGCLHYSFVFHLFSPFSKFGLSYMLPITSIGTNGVRFASPVFVWMQRAKKAVCFSLHSMT